MASSLVAAALGLLFFTASDFEHGKELWVSDGTGSETRMAADLTPGEGDTRFDSSLIPASGGVFFLATLGGTGATDLYFSDGTKGGTRQVSLPGGIDRFYGTVGVNVYFAVLGSPNLFFVNLETHAITELPAPTDAYQTGFLTIVDLKGKALIVALPSNATQGPTGLNYAVYLHDPVLNTIKKLPVSFDTETAPRVASLGDRFVFAHNTAKSGYELWVSDGTAKGTRLVKDIIKGSIGGLDPRWSVEGPLAFQGKGYFIANDNKRGAELWTTDGTTDGTRLLVDLKPGGASANVLFTNRTSDPFYSRLLTIGGRVAFVEDTTSDRSMFYTTDGTPEGTILHAMTDAGGVAVRPAWGLGAVMGTYSAALFEGRKAGDMRQTALYSVNLNTDRATLLRDINHTPDCLDTPLNPTEYDFIFSFTRRAKETFFAAADKTTIIECPDRYNNSELWKTDHTAEGTKRVKEIFPGIGGSIGKQYRDHGSSPDSIVVGGTP